MTAQSHPTQSEGPSADRELSHRTQITDLIARLGACLDEHRFADVRDLLTEDASAATPGGIVTGRDAVLEQVTVNHQGHARLHHQISDVLIDLDGDRAAVRANVLATFAHSDGRPEFMLGAVYRFQTRRAGPEWRIARVEVTPTWRLPFPELSTVANP